MIRRLRRDVFEPFEVMEVCVNCSVSSLLIYEVNYGNLLQELLYGLEFS